MKTDVFIATENYQKTSELVNELIATAYGVEMAVITGRAGRGKPTAAERIYATNPGTVYVLYQEGWSYIELLREITFRLCGTRPRYRQTCFEMVANELAAKRRVIMIDEADRMNLRCLNGVRNIHDICRVPVLMIGEEALASHLEAERRLISRVRASIAFAAVSQADVVVFFSQALGQKLTPDYAARLIKHAGGDFRRVLTGAVRAERIMRASGIDTITDAVINAVVKI